MSTTTRLVVLGAVHQFQPVHGYFLRRQLTAWHIDEWASIQAGSVYHALRSLTAEGSLCEDGTETAGNRPERTTYCTTDAGDAELVRTLRAMMHSVAVFDTKPVMVLSCFMFALPRTEVLAGLQYRTLEIDARIANNTHHIAAGAVGAAGAVDAAGGAGAAGAAASGSGAGAGAATKPAAAVGTVAPRPSREVLELANAHLRGQQQWAHALSQRISAGDYIFAGETAR